MSRKTDLLNRLAILDYDLKDITDVMIHEDDQEEYQKLAYARMDMIRERDDILDELNELEQ